VLFKGPIDDVDKIRFSDSIKKLSSLPDLNSVSFQNIYLNDSDIQQISNLSNIEYLFMSEVNLRSDNDGSDDLSFLKSMSGLKSLALCSMLISDDNLKYIASLSSIEHLAIEDSNKLSGIGFFYLQDMPKLESLLLSESSINDLGMREIGKLLHLKRLVLSYTNITDIGIGSLKQLKSLEELSLNGTNISIDKVKDLSFMLPKCRISFGKYAFMGGVVIPENAREKGGRTILAIDGFLRKKVFRHSVFLNAAKNLPHN
jgi:internalin A